MLKKFVSGLLLAICLVSFSGVGFSQGNVYVGSTRSNKYHYTWCQWAQKVNPKNKLVFNSVKEAQAAGYIPCKVCRPPIKD